jgi:hypothetical protein
VALVVVAACGRPSTAEERFDEDGQLWTQVSATFVLDAGPVKLVPYLELQPRFDDDAQDLDVVQHRAALLVRPIEGLSIGPGFVWVAELEESYEAEYRVYEEARWEGGPLGSGVRLRFEQRFFDGEDPVSHRVRLRVGIEPKLFELVEMPVSLVLSNEVFANLDDQAGHREGFEQNRAFAGLSLKIAKGIKVTSGYMAVLRNRWGEPDGLGHTMVVMLDFTFS